jgi:hypothetical protein
LWLYTAKLSRLYLLEILSPLSKALKTHLKLNLRMLADPLKSGWQKSEALHKKKLNISVNLSLSPALK